MDKELDWELINSYGPWTMSPWKSKNGVVIGFEYGMDGRSEVIAKTIIDFLAKLDLGTDTELVEFAGHDGWLSHELFKKFNFKKLLVVEPREKNISKGVFIRKILGIQDSVEFATQSIESFAPRTFDVAIANGVLYHVNSLELTIKKLATHTKNLLIIESRVISGKHLTKRMRMQIEANDLPYKLNRNELVGFSGHKYETAFSDGSAHVNSIVTLPTTDLLLMHLKMAGFTRTQILLNEKEFRKKLRRHERPLDGVIIAAWKGNAKDKVDQIKQSGEIEAEYVSSTLDLKSIRKLDLLSSKGNPLGWILRVMMHPKNYHNRFTNFILLKLIFKSEQNKFILSDLKFAPAEKLLYEKAKYSLSQNNPAKAEKILLEILRTPNCDWRTYYRSVYLLQLFYGDSQPQKMSKMRELLQRSNPNHFSLLNQGDL